MGFFNTLLGWFTTSSADYTIEPASVNPDNDLSMMGSIGGGDVLGDLFDTDFSDSLHDSSSMLVNPASGLPMMDGMGGMDVAGNPFGTDFSDSLHDSTSMLVNPASGLPMMDGMGGMDVAGNPFGTDLSDSFSDPFDSFGSMGGFNDDF